MTTKAKTFDCVEMKRRIQESLRAEYQSRNAEFASYYDFLEAKAEGSSWVRKMREKFARKE